jgi:choline dehydrogenase-like flavoprotein
VTAERDFVDARRLDPGTVLDADVCVVGAGAAGIVLALELSAAGHRTVLLEAGGLDDDAWTTELFSGENLGLPYWPLDECRGHRFGGTTYKYAGHSKPVVARDFAPVPGVPLASWPIAFDDVAPWVRAAVAMLGYEPSAFDVSTQLERAGMPEAPSYPELAETSLFVRDGPVAKPYPRRLAERIHAARNLEIVVHAVVTSVALDAEGERVARLEVGTENRGTFEVVAREYVLACHAVENARLLLDSDDVVATGIGNASGMLGRCFMDHPHLDAGRVHFSRDIPWHLVYPEASSHGFAACVAAPQRLTDAASCLQYFCRLLPVEHGHDGADAVARLARTWRHPRGPRFRSSLARAARDPVHASIGLARLAGARPREFVLNHRIEQAPNLDSRVVLLAARDALGRRRVGVDWQLSDTDARTLEVGQAAALRYLERVGATRLRGARTDLEFVATRGATYWHHIGTTRMSESPSDGVVDPHCRVNGVDNLSVAGSSVFCRATFSPPTMTIVAFTLRLADTIDRRLRQR